MQLDFSDQIKAANLFSVKTPSYDEFKLSENGEKFLQTFASADKNVLVSVLENAFAAAKTFHRPGVSDFEMAIARLSRYTKTGDAKLLTTNYVDLENIEFGLAKVLIVQNKLSEKDFRAEASKVEIEICDCEEPEMEDGEESDASKTCAKCGKKTKAKKNC